MYFKSITAHQNVLNNNLSSRLIYTITSIFLANVKRFWPYVKIYHRHVSVCRTERRKQREVSVATIDVKDVLNRDVVSQVLRFRIRRHVRQGDDASVDVCIFIT